ncbi:hypothetical protein [Parapedobacter luteus]|uniref:hypothetical protein n=1 Tax=Parapedobacter luteus TaxID=623280 RepID=UPI0011172592|nr:hypothetical protein [Parapedobacter luteus]
MLIGLLALASTSFVGSRQEKGLKDYYADYFPIGVVVTREVLSARKTKISRYTARGCRHPGPFLSHQKTTTEDTSYFGAPAKQRGKIKEMTKTRTTQ